MKEILRIEHIWKEYQMGEFLFQALKDINFSINEGELLSLIGPSGSGKSTLMHIIGLLDKPTRGDIFADSRDISKMNDEKLSTLRNEFVGFVFQQFNLMNKLNVLENILLPTVYTRKELDYDPYERARFLLKRFNISDKEKSYPNKISGGQQQKVAIARALIMNPKLILADEPTGNLDTKSGVEIIKLLKKLNEEEKMTIVIVTHDASIAKQTKRVVKILDGEIIK